MFTPEVRVQKTVIGFPMFDVERQIQAPTKIPGTWRRSIVRNSLSSHLENAGTPNYFICFI